MVFRFGNYKIPVKAGMLPVPELYQFRFVDYHILVKSGMRRSRSVPPFRSGNYNNPA